MVLVLTKHADFVHLVLACMFWIISTYVLSPHFGISITLAIKKCFRVILPVPGRGSRGSCVSGNMGNSCFSQYAHVSSSYQIFNWFQSSEAYLLWSWLCILLFLITFKHYSISIIWQFNNHWSPFCWKLLVMDDKGILHVWNLIMGFSRDKFLNMHFFLRKIFSFILKVPLMCKYISHR